MARTGSAYDAGAIQMLEGLEAVRKRPGMYIGGTGSEGLSHLLWELIDNAIDEAAAGHAARVTVLFWPDGSYEVRDDGRGIPIDRHPKKKVSALEVVFTELHAGGKFGGGAYTASGGLHGVGASVVNALARQVVVEVDRDGKTHRLAFVDRVAGTFEDGRFRRGHDLEVVGRVKPGVTGTRVRFWPDTALFSPDATISYPEVRERVAQMCFLVPGLEVTLVDHREGASGEPERFSSKRGLVDYVEHLSVGESITDVVTITGTGTFTENVPVDGRMTEVERTCGVELALRWVKGFETKIVSFVNTIPTTDGGTHVAGFERAMTFALNAELRLDEAKKLKRFKDEARATREDVQEGLVAVLKVVVPEPQFRGQTKRELGTPKVQSITYDVVKSGVVDWVTTSGRKSHVNALRDKVIGAIEARLVSRQQRELVRRASSLGSTGLPDKLADCRSTAVADTELLIVEGDSAAGPTKSGRNAEFQAVLPIRGKILNAGKATLKQVLENAEAEALFTALGGGSGAEFDPAACRYGRVVILADADVDGAHIRCLLLTLFYGYLRPLLEQGRVFVAMPPLYTITERRAARTDDGPDTAAEGRRSKRTKGEKTKHYAYDDADRDRICAALDAAGVGYSIGRNKGLGEMDVDELATTTLDPESRVLRRVTLRDGAEAAEAARMFDVLMGREVAPRKDWIVDRAAFLDRESLDI
ncbi:MAG: type IIA DNA topoisomerase subunit B [Actinobacteria bacterium]|nr:type IIA DNA topoisomerase subunit B [Actinomycetota bacterium]